MLQRILIKRAPTLALASVWLASPVAIQAQEARAFQYDYLEANYVNTELDAGGFEIAGSLEVADRIHLFAGYLDQDYGDGLDRSLLQIGGGYRWALTPTLDAIAELAIAESDIDRRVGPDRDGDGFILGARLRGWMSPTVELNGAVLLDDSNDSDADLVVEFGGQYHLNPAFSVGGRLRTDDDATALFLGGRYYFR